MKMRGTEPRTLYGTQQIANMSVIDDNKEDG